MKKEEYALKETINDMKRCIEQFEEKALKILVKKKKNEERRIKKRKGR